ncbi:MAG: hypothetical protein A2X47_07035 [Lentisphaerae bacterium GWF2_38_69]|nr:MAG: hypothetical protein A2X47_07035 [Lentisphaerae bacterium GWF2_38_69]
MEELKYYESEQGTPQGGIISPLLANIYLDSLDKEMEARGHRIVRYADDSVILCKSSEEAEAALNHLESWMKKAELELNYEKTKNSR